MSQKGDGGDSGVEGMLAACSLGAVAKAVGRDVAGERQRQNFKGLMWVAVGGGEGKCSKGGKTWRGQRKEEVVVVEEKKTNKESASGTAGFEPQAQSVKAHGRCLGLISGSMCDPMLHTPVKD